MYVTTVTIHGDEGFEPSVMAVTLHNEDRRLKSRVFLVPGALVLGQMIPNLVTIRVFNHLTASFGTRRVLPPDGEGGDNNGRL